MSASSPSDRRFTVRVRRGLRILSQMVPRESYEPRPRYFDLTFSQLTPAHARDVRAAIEWINGLRDERRPR